MSNLSERHKDYHERYKDRNHEKYKPKDTKIGGANVQGLLHAQAKTALTKVTLLYLCVILKASHNTACGRTVEASNEARVFTEVSPGNTVLQSASSVENHNGY